MVYLPLMTEDLTKLTDEELAQKKADAWSMFQLVSRGNSAKAVDANWAKWDALRKEEHRRNYERKHGGN